MNATTTSTGTFTGNLSCDITGTSPTTTSTGTLTTVTSVVDRFLAAIESGRGADLSGVYADDAALDATVPNWRFSVTGATAIGTEYTRWFSHPGRFEELDRRETAGGAVVTYLLAWDENGVPHASHHCHVLTIEPSADGGRIVADHVWCGGRWTATMLAEMEAARHGG